MKKNRAIVIGAGFAGLVAARVLSDHFESVIVIEKDDRGGSSFPRTGVPQGAHLHVLLKRGQALLQSLFSNIEEKFIHNECPIIDWAQDTRWESSTGSFPRYLSDLKTYSFSRPFLESCVYSLVKERSNVSFIHAHVEELVIESNHAEHLRCKDVDSPYGADMFVLAGGHNFPVNRLTKYDVDKENLHVPIQISYRSVVFETQTLRFDGFKQYYYQMTAPHDPVGAVICPIEDGRSIATIIEYGKPKGLKTDLCGFMKMAETVPGREFFRIIEQGRALSDVAAFHKPTMYMRRPDKIKNFPENVFCFGDVFCSLNPVFGQGMTSALIQGQLLNELLQKTSFHSRNFHKKSVVRLRLPYLLSKLGSNVKPDFSYRYLKSYISRCQNSEKMHKKFLGALHLEKSYGSLLDLPALLRSWRKNG